MLNDKELDEFCKSNVVNTALFRDNSAKFLDPTFDIKSFLCEVLKLTDLPNVDPVLKKPVEEFYLQKTDYSGLTAVGDPRVPLGLVLSAGFINFMPRNIVFSETMKYGAAQVINDYICDSDGNPIKVSTSTNIPDSPIEEKELLVSNILQSKEVVDIYPTYDFSRSICLEPQTPDIATLPESVDTIDTITPPVVTPFTPEHRYLFSHGNTIDICTEPLDVNRLFVRTTPQEYEDFTNNFIKYGREQHTSYFAEFIKRFFTSRSYTEGVEVTLHQSELPPFFYVKIRERIKKIPVDFEVRIIQSAPPNVITTYKYTSNVKYTYLRYHPDQSSTIAKLLNIDSKIVGTSIGIKATSNNMFRTLVEGIPDYRRIMKSADIQKKFYLYVKKYFVEVPTYQDSNEYLDNPIKNSFAG